jgi:uncharacterized protein YegP (UPF0339 family)
MYFVIYRDRQGHWRWSLNAASHKTIADSAEGYWNESDCLDAIYLVKESYDATIFRR